MSLAVTVGQVIVYVDETGFATDARVIKIVSGASMLATLKVQPLRQDLRKPGGIELRYGRRPGWIFTSDPIPRAWRSR